MTIDLCCRSQSVPDKKVTHRSLDKVRDQPQSLLRRLTRSNKSRLQLFRTTKFCLSHPQYCLQDSGRETNVSGREVWDASVHAVGSGTGLTSCRRAAVTYWKCQAVRRGFEIRKTAGVYRGSTRAPVIRRAFSSLKIGQKQIRKIEDKQESRKNTFGEL
jgi:hypothetical protein